MTAADDFVEFATAAAPRLRRTAYLMCGNWHTAEDLAQTTLTKMFVSWRRVRRNDAVFAYASRTLVNTYIATTRARRSSEVITDVLPEQAAVSDSLETRMLVTQALGTLAPRSRAVVVLRYFGDMSVEEVAASLGCSTGTVKSQCARALEKMRSTLSGNQEDGRQADGHQGQRRHG